MKPVEIEFLIHDKTGDGARRVSASIDRAMVQTIGKIDSIQKKIDKLRESSVGSVDTSESVAEIKKLEKQLEKLQNKLKQTAAASKDAVPNPSTISQAARQYNGLNMSVQQLARELPSLAVGPQMFFMAISNNLPIFSDELARARTEYQAMMAAGQKGTPVWKQLLSSLTSWQTALAVGITLLVTYGDEIWDWAKGLFKGAEALDASSIAAARFHSAMLDGARNAQAEVIKLNLLYRAATDNAASMDERRVAAEKLRELYPSYFESLTTEQILLGGANEQYQSLVKNVYAYAKAQAALKSMISAAEQEQTLQGASSFDSYMKRYRKLQEAREREAKAQVEYDKLPWQERGNASVEYKELRDAKSWRNLYKREEEKAAKELVAELKKLPGGEDTVRTIEEQFKGEIGALVDALEEQRLRLEDVAQEALTTESPSSKEPKVPLLQAATPDAKERELLLRAMRDLEDEQLAIMTDGYEKRRREAQQQFERQLHEIQENRAALLEADRKENAGKGGAQINTLFDSRVVATFENYKNTLRAIDEEQQAEADKAYGALLTKYETYLQKRKRLTSEYDADIEALSLRGTPIETQQQAELTKKKALQELDVAFANQFPQFEEWANHIVTLSVEKLRGLLEMAKVELEMLTGSGTADDAAIAKTNAAIVTLEGALNRMKPPKVSPNKEDFKDWAELEKVLSSAGREFAELGDIFDATLGDILSAAGQVSSATVSAISGIKQLVDNSAKGIEATAATATASMSSLEKASVVLSVISAAFSVFNAISSLFGGGESDLERNLRLAREFNEELVLMKQRALMKKDEGSIFGENIYGNFQNNVAAMRKAMAELEEDRNAIRYRWKGGVFGANFLDPYQNIEESIANMQSRTRHSTWFRSAEYASLKDLVPELFGDNGQIDMEALKAFADENNSVFVHLSEANQALIKSLVDDWETYEEAMSGVRDYLTSIFGEMGDTMLDAMLKVSEGMSSTEDAMASMVDSMSQMIRQWVENMIYAATIGPILEQAQKDIEAIIENGGTEEEQYNAILGVLDRTLGLVSQSQEEATDYWTMYQQLAEKYGFDISGSSAQRGKEGVMHTVSQESFTRMEGILTSIQGYLASRDVGIDNITDILLQQLEATHSIAANTQTLPLLYALLNKMNQFGIKVQ